MRSRHCSLSRSSLSITLLLLYKHYQKGTISPGEWLIGSGKMVGTKNRLESLWSGFQETILSAILLDTFG